MYKTREGENIKKELNKISDELKKNLKEEKNPAVEQNGESIMEETYKAAFVAMSKDALPVIISAREGAMMVMQPKNTEQKYVK